MSFGVGVGDIINVSSVAWNVYKSCKDAPDSFGNIHSEVLAFHAVLKEAGELVATRPLSAAQQERFKAIAYGCNCVLEDLQSLVAQYQRLGTQERRTWDRLKWGAENITDLRARLTSNATMLNTWIRCVHLLLRNHCLYPPKPVLIMNAAACPKPTLRRNSITS
jgi:hypothetical protein